MVGLEWVTSMFFSGRSLREIGKDVLKNEVVPNVQDGVYNSLTSMLRMAVYRDAKPGAVNTAAPGSFITNYVSYGDRNKQKAAALEATKQKEAETVKSGYELPAFPSREMAEQFLMSMKAYVQKYPTISVHDLAWMQQKDIDYTWEKWGWDADEIMAIKTPVRFPQPVYIDDGKGGKFKLTHYIDMPKAHEIE